MKRKGKRKVEEEDVVNLTKGEKRISKQDLKEEGLQWKVEMQRLGDLLGVLCRDSGDLE